MQEREELVLPALLGLDTGVAGLICLLVDQVVVSVTAVKLVLVVVRLK